MTVLSIVVAPNPIFKKKAAKVATITDEIKKAANDMVETLHFHQAYGLGANMVGLLHRIAVVDMYENDKKNPYIFINPEIVEKSTETQIFEEASLSYPFISAKIERPSKITLKYQDLNGDQKELKAEGFFATVIQHEVDYLDGIVFADHLSEMKREMLLKKMQKAVKYGGK